MRKRKSFATRWTPIRTRRLCLAISCSNSPRSQVQRTSIGKAFLPFGKHGQISNALSKRQESLADTGPLHLRPRTVAARDRSTQSSSVASAEDQYRQGFLADTGPLHLRP